MEQELNDRDDHARSDAATETASLDQSSSAAGGEVVDEQLIEEISIDGMCGVY